MHDKKLFFAILKRMATSYGKFFLSITGLFCCLFIGYLCYSSYTLNLSQKRIKDYYINHINKTDSLCFSISAYNTALIENIQKANNALLADSLIKYTLGSKQKLSENQYKDLSTIISNYYNQSIKIQEQHQSKLSRDSLQFNAERTLLEGQTKAMIDLHLTKIDHEYNNITMWAAILTILFLVFSFYSIFKMDELIQQGREGVKDIKRLKKVGDDSIAYIKAKNNEQITKLKEDTEQIIKEHREKLEGISSNFSVQQNDLYRRADEYLNGLRRNSDEQSQKILSEYYNILQEQSKTYTQKINEKTEGFESKLASIGEFTIALQQVKEKLDSYLNDVKEQISSIEEQKRLFAVIITTLQNSINDTTEGNANLAKFIEKLQEAMKKNQIKNDSENGGQQDGQ
ncbi:hypothetical protein [Phocaeicola faecicola]|uniref:hypothetical protein n=1 Tax=Phocaeicola faecicola TaxID=2739389 RepID=UPI0015E7D330|nr:hypothetical protein [Phocaeicola faecicola]